MIRGEPGTSVTLDILRGENDQLITVPVVRAALKVPMIKTEIFVAPNDPKTKFAYIKLAQFGVGFQAKMVEAINDVLKQNPDITGTVFDVRGNHGGRLNEVYYSLGALASSPDAFVSIRDNGGVQGLDKVSGKLKPLLGDITHGLPCAVLVDGHSASASEIFAGVLKQLGRCVIIGKGTWQKGSVQDDFRIGDGSDGTVMHRTIAEFVIGSPKKWIAVQCIGVDPDIVYEADALIAPTQEKHECDREGAIASGGTSSDPNVVPEPLLLRDPALYRFGEQVILAVKVYDHTELLKFKATLAKMKVDPNEETER